MIRWSRTIWLGSFLALLLIAVSSVDGKKQVTPEPSPVKSTKLKESEPEIEEVTAKQLERVLNEKDFVAVFWCKSSSGFIPDFQLTWSRDVFHNHFNHMHGNQQRKYISQKSRAFTLF
jgi:hypothetical protein